jgi:16S rRNA (cytosine1402-N4)-methyltransferase
MGSQHIPVLVEEVMNLLRCEAHKTYVDATIGGGGHALEVLKRTSPDGIIGSIGMKKQIAKPKGHW